MTEDSRDLSSPPLSMGWDLIEVAVDLDSFPISPASLVGVGLPGFVLSSGGTRCLPRTSTLSSIGRSGMGTGVGEATC